MKRNLMVLCAGLIAAGCLGQTAKAPIPAKEPDATELKLMLSQAEEQIAEKDAEIHELQYELQLLEKATGISDRRAADQQRIQAARREQGDAQKAVDAARAPAKETKAK